MFNESLKAHRVSHLAPIHSVFSVLCCFVVLQNRFWRFCRLAVQSPPHFPMASPIAFIYSDQEEDRCNDLYLIRVDRMICIVLCRW